MNLLKLSLLSILLLILFSACTPKDTVDFLAGTPDITSGVTNKILLEVSYENSFKEIFVGSNAKKTIDTNEWTRTTGEYTERAMILSNDDSVQIIVRKLYTDGRKVEVKKYYTFFDAGSTNLSLTTVDGTNKRTTFRSAESLNSFINNFKTLDDYYNIKI